MGYEELRYFTDWFYIDDVKAVKIREKVISSIRNEDLFFCQMLVGVTLMQVMFLG